MKSTTLRKALAGVAVAVVGIQLIPVDRTNPPPNGPMALPAGEVGEILTGACMDCHSHETVWPWYARVAPAKFLMASHVSEGRRVFNLSTWEQRTPERKAHKLEEVVDLVKSGEMPLPTYTWLHPEARLTDAQRQALTAWAEAERARLQAAGAGSAEAADSTGAGEEGARAEGREESEGRREPGQR